jgi:phosphohistidine phosphatase
MHAQTTPQRYSLGVAIRVAATGILFLAMATHLWLLRHGEAEPRGTRPDSRRALTERGARQARAAGLALARRRVRLSAVLTSPRVRARDTARLACEALNGLEPTTYRPLSAGFDGRHARAMIAERGSNGHLMIVGHEPDFSQTIYDLAGARVDLKKGGLAMLRVSAEGGQLLLLLRPGEIELIAGGV